MNCLKLVLFYLFKQHTNQNEEMNYLSYTLLRTEDQSRRLVAHSFGLLAKKTKPWKPLNYGIVTLECSPRNFPGGR